MLLEHAVVRDVVSLVNGRRSATQIATALEKEHRPELVYYALLALAHHGIVREEPLSPDIPGESQPLDARSRFLAEALRDAWANRGGRQVLRLDLNALLSVECDLILTDDYLHEELRQVVGSSRAHVLAAVGHSRVWLGPWVLSRTTSCGRCLQERLGLNLVARSLLHVADGRGDEDLRVRRIGHRVPFRAFEKLAAALIEHIRDSGGHELMDALWVMPLDAGTRQRHTVQRLPQCPSCGDPFHGPPGPNIELVSRGKRSGPGGGYRVADPADTLHRFGPLISPLTGVVRTITKVPVDDNNLVHVYSATHGSHGGRPSLRALKAEFRDPSGGKGRTDIDAKVSALCESLERFSGAHRGDENVRLASYSELGSAAIHPNEILLFSETQFARRDELNRSDSSGFQWIPEPYGNETIEWSSVRSLTTGALRFVPSSLVFTGFEGAGRSYCKGDSNGLAGGNCLEEAILQGFLELVERDAVSLWWYSRARVPGVDLRNLPDPYMHQIVTFYASLEREVWALDLTTDLGIPCFAVLSRLTSEAKQDIIFGFGAHLDPGIALSRALTELNQMLPMVLRPARERRRDLLPEFADAILWWDTATVEDHQYLLPRRDASTGRVDDFRAPDHEDLLEDVRHCVALAQGVGHEVLVHDLTRPDVGLSVVRVIAPGLRHFWRRLAPGRLYDVPPRLGWVKSTMHENAMNPVAMFV